MVLLPSMDLLILGDIEAADYTPEDLTYAIRIFSIDPRSRELTPNLKPSELYHTKEYEFDDITPEKGKGFLFDEDTARKILQDFQTQRDGHKTLLVHCSLGRNRSPAIGMSLNEIFNLGHDADALKNQFQNYNPHVYETMKKTAETIGLNQP